jgi:hypothetical protein
MPCEHPENLGFGAISGKGLMWYSAGALEDDVGCVWFGTQWG